MLAPDLRDGGIGVAVLAGVDESCCSRRCRQLGYRWARSLNMKNGRSLKTCCAASEAGKPSVVMSEPTYAGISSLIFVVASKRVTKLRTVEELRVRVVGQQDVAPVGHVLGIVRVPSAVKDVGGREEQPVIGKPGEDALLLALGPIHADVEPVRMSGSRPGTEKLLATSVVAESQVEGGVVALRHVRQVQQGDGIGVRDYVAGKRRAACRPIVGLSSDRRS